MGFLITFGTWFYRMIFHSRSSLFEHIVLPSSFLSLELCGIVFITSMSVLQPKSHEKLKEPNSPPNGSILFSSWFFSNLFRSLWSGYFNNLNRFNFFNFFNLGNNLMSNFSVSILIIIFKSNWLVVPFVFLFVNFRVYRITFLIMSGFLVIIKWCEIPGNYSSFGSEMVSSLEVDVLEPSQFFVFNLRMSFSINNRYSFHLCRASSHLRFDLLSFHINWSRILLFTWALGWTLFWWLTATFKIWDH